MSLSHLYSLITKISQCHYVALERGSAYYVQADFTNFVVCLLVLFRLVLFVCFDSKRSSHECFSHVGTGIPGMNQYLADDKVSCSRKQRSASFHLVPQVGMCLWHVALTYSLV